MLVENENKYILVVILYIVSDYVTSVSLCMTF